MILWNYFEFWPVLQEEMAFKDISYLELRRPSCSAERTQLCNFGREHYGKINLKLL